MQSNFNAVFRRHVGRGRPWQVRNLAAATGITERTLQSYLSGETEPCWAKLLLVARALGAEFMDALLAPVNMGGVHVVIDSEADARLHMADMARHLSALADAMEDGMLDHRERARLAPDIRAHGVRCIEFAKALECNNLARNAA